jgi:hypothetical protein
LERDQQDLFATDEGAQQKESVTDWDVPFSLNIGSFTPADGEASPAYVNAYKDTDAENDFWVIYQLGAFQGELKGDADPDSEIRPRAVEFGARVSSLIPWIYLTLVFNEALYDLSAGGSPRHDDVNSLRQSTSAHEAAHCFGVPDRVLVLQGLMGSISDNLDNQLLSSEELGIVMRALRPER